MDGGLKLETVDKWSGELGKSVVMLSVIELCFEKGLGSVRYEGLSKPLCESESSCAIEGVGVGSRLMQAKFCALSIFCFLSMLGLNCACLSANSDVVVL